MKNILCFGDSNTYGLIPFGGRLDEHTRWTRVLSSLLGKDYWIHEEGLNGRTTGLDDPVWPGRNALDYLDLCLETHEPLDLTILMLGTNDLKICFSPPDPGEKNTAGIPCSSDRKSCTSGRKNVHRPLCLRLSARICSGIPPVIFCLAGNGRCLRCLVFRCRGLRRSVGY